MATAKKTSVALKVIDNASGPLQDVADAAEDTADAVEDLNGRLRDTKGRFTKAGTSASTAGKKFKKAGADAADGHKNFKLTSGGLKSLAGPAMAAAAAPAFLNF